MKDLQSATQTVNDFLQAVITSGRFSLTFRSVIQSEPVPSIQVTFEGPDSPLLTSHNGELLLALEHVAAKVLRLEPDEHDQISFEAEAFKAKREQAMRLAAEAAVQHVRASKQPYSFPPMNSRERRLLHLALTPSGLCAASSGVAPSRHVVLYPAGYAADS